MLVKIASKIASFLVCMICIAALYKFFLADKIKELVDKEKNK